LIDEKFYHSFVKNRIHISLCSPNRTDQSGSSPAWKGPQRDLGIAFGHLPDIISNISYSTAVRQRTPAVSHPQLPSSSSILVVHFIVCLRVSQRSSDVSFPDIANPTNPTNFWRDSSSRSAQSEWNQATVRPVEASRWILDGFVQALSLSLSFPSPPSLFFSK